MKRSSGYDSYHGKSRMRTILKAIIVALVVILAILIAAFFLLQDYVYYTPEGRVQIVLPFLDRDKDEDAPVPTVVVTSAPSAAPTPTPAPAAAGTPLRAVAVPLSALSDGSAAQAVTAAGGNAALFDMKGDDGMLGYVSALPQAVNWATSGADTTVGAGLASLKAAGVRTVARVSCFRDNRVPRQDNGLSLRVSAGNWTDSDGVRWISPALAVNQDYVAGICGELAALGFDEILLDNAAFPVDAKTGSIVAGERYDAGQFTGALTTFYGKVKTALGAYPEVKLLIAGSSAAVAAGADAASGQTAELLLQSADQVVTGETAAAAVYPADRLVTRLAAAPGAETAGSWIAG